MTSSGEGSGWSETLQELTVLAGDVGKLSQRVDALGGLPGRVDQLDQRYRELSNGLEVLTDRIDSLTDRIKQLGTTAKDDDEEDDTPLPWCWPALSEAEAEQAWRELDAWVTGVLLERYPTVGRVLAGCWPRHPDVVEELSALYAAWLAAYRWSKRRPTDGADWHNRLLPAAVDRLGSRDRRLSLVACKSGIKDGHQPLDARIWDHQEHLAEAMRADLDWRREHLG